MDLEKIKQVLLSSSIPDSYKEKTILTIISEDDKVIKYVLFMLDIERQERKEILGEMNVLLSQSETVLQPTKINKDNFIKTKIIDFYKKHKETKGVFHCFTDDIDKKKKHKS